MTNHHHDHDRRVAKAQARGFLTLGHQRDAALVERWTEQCRERVWPLIMVCPMPEGTAILILQGLSGAVAETVAQLVAVSAEDDVTNAPFPIDRNVDGTITLGPFMLARARAVAARIVADVKATQQAA